MRQFKKRVLAHVSPRNINSIILRPLDVPVYAGVVCWEGQPTVSTLNAVEEPPPDQ